MDAKLVHWMPSWVCQRGRRHGVVRTASVLILTGLLLVQGPVAGLAGVGWCRSDPVVMINGTAADVFVSVPVDDLLTISGPTEFVITVPNGTDAFLVAAGVGFGYGEVVEFRESGSLKATPTGIELRVAVYVPATDKSTPVLVEFAPRIIGILDPASVEGAANAWISLRTMV